MSARATDTYTTIAAIAAITIITCTCLLLGIDETLVKLGLVAIAGLAGFSIRGLIRWQ